MPLRCAFELMTTVLALLLVQVFPTGTANNMWAFLFLSLVICSIHGTKLRAVPQSVGQGFTRVKACHPQV